MDGSYALSVGCQKVLLFPPALGIGQDPERCWIRLVLPGAFVCVGKSRASWTLESSILAIYVAEAEMGGEQSSVSGELCKIQVPASVVDRCMTLLDLLQ